MFSREKLIRPARGRYVAGVSGAIANATNTDPVLWRVVLAVLGFFGGVGVLIYLVGWLMIPAEGDTASPIESILGRGRSAMAPLSVLLLGLAAALTFAFVVRDGMRATLLAAAVLVCGALVIRKGGRSHSTTATSGGPGWSPASAGPGGAPAPGTAWSAATTATPPASSTTFPAWSNAGNYAGGEAGSNTATTTAFPATGPAAAHATGPGAAHATGPGAAHATGPGAAQATGPGAAQATGPGAAQATGPGAAHASGPAGAEAAGPGAAQADDSDEPTTAFATATTPEAATAAEAAHAAEAANAPDSATAPAGYPLTGPSPTETPMTQTQHEQAPTPPNYLPPRPPDFGPQFTPSQFVPPTGGYRPPFAPHGPWAQGTGQPPYPQAPPPKPPKRPKPPRERSKLGRITFFMVVVVMGLMAVLDLAGVPVPVSAYFAAALATIGLGLVVGAWFGRARGLIFLAVLVSFGLLISTGTERWGGELGNSSYRPQSIQAVADRYDFTIGTATLDLRAVDFSKQPAEQVTTIAMKVGQLKVLLPDNVDATTVVSMDSGRAQIFGRDWDGRELGSQELTDNGPDGPGGGKLRLNIEMNTGDVEVTR